MPSQSNSNNLKSIGLKATLPRLKILELFHKAQTGSAVHHMTADDVHRLLIGEQIDIGLATVYRVLTQFEQAGLLTRHNFETGKAVFELNEGKHHDHLICLQCGQVLEFHDSEIEKRQTMLARERGFDLQGHALTLYGDCLKADCPNRKSSG